MRGGVEIGIVGGGGGFVAGVGVGVGATEGNAAVTGGMSYFCI